MRLSRLLGLAMAFSLCAPVLHPSAHAGLGGLCAVANHYPGIPYTTAQAYWTGSYWSYYDVRPWTTPNTYGVHVICNHDWGSYLNLVVSAWWNSSQNNYYFDAYGYGSSVGGYP